MQSSRGVIGRQLAARFLGRIGEALILLFIVSVGFGLFPLQVVNAGWQERAASLLRTLSIYPLLGAALIFLCENQARSVSPPLFPLRRIQKLAPLAALGFVLLIPLQTSSMYVQIRDSDNMAQRTIRQVERQINGFRAIPSLEQLQQVTQNLPPELRPAPGVSLVEGRARLIAQAESELGRLRVLSNKAKSDMIRKAVPDAIRNALICLIYGVAFFGIRPLGSVSMIGPSAIDPEWDGDPME